VVPGSDGTAVVLVAFSTPGTEVDVVGLWCGPVVGGDVVSVGWVGEVVSAGAREVDGAGRPGRTVVVVGTIVVVVPLWVIVMLSPGARPLLT
jgi:hypothetical protein